MNKKKKYTSKYYLAIFVDILGQQDKLSKMTKLPSNIEEQEKYNKLIKETIGAVDKFRESIDLTFKQNIEKSFEDILNTPQVDKKFKDTLSKILNIKLNYFHFSDTVILYYPLDVTEENKSLFFTIYHALLALSGAVINLFAEEIPVRGAIEIGIGTELEYNNSQQLYGSILNSLHYLESKCAKYPRILIGPELMKAINSGRDYSNPIYREKNPANDLEKLWIKNIKECITKHDKDNEYNPTGNLYELNYLTYMKTMKTKNKTFNEIENYIKKEIEEFKQKNKFIQQEIEEFKQKNKFDDELKKKETILKKYKTLEDRYNQVMIYINKKRRELEKC